MEVKQLFLWKNDLEYIIFIKGYYPLKMDKNLKCKEPHYKPHKSSTLCVVCVCVCAKLCPTLCDPMHQAPLSMEFSRQEYWSGLPFLYSRGYSWPKDQTCISCIDRKIFFTTEPPGKSKSAIYVFLKLPTAYKISQKHKV